MSHWQKIRDAANNLRREICAASGLNENELIPARQFLSLAAGYLELDLVPEHPDSNNLQKALAVLEDDCIYFNNHLKEWFRAFCIAHEIGHHRLHHRSVHCTQDEIEGFAADSENTAIGKIVGYGAGERREREANLFALELFLPCGVLKSAFLEKGRSAREIAEITGLPEAVAANQLARALLVPVAESKTEEYVSEIPDLDDSQRRAAKTENCPTLVAAGPGTGKTQTLTGRIAHLIEQGIQPKRILALTFSNKAAEEMRERIGQIDRRAAAQIQVMTFHAFGLDILRTYWAEAGLEPHSPLLDKIDALLYLENNLNFLELAHYEMLHEPTGNLTAILGAISRAKDELCTPEEYRVFGEKMLAEAREQADEELKIKAERALETAGVYEFYQKYLEKEKLLDFGDLIFRAVFLLRENEAVGREVRAKFDAILVDEFQDVNRACGVLLREIAGEGKNLWAVGDLRQSVYRWRGASPANINLFDTDFPNAETVSLKTNYRSRAEIIGLFSRFAPQMKAAGAGFFHLWEAKRGAAGDENKSAINLEISDSPETEAAQIAENILRYRKEGFKYKDFAVICRTHNQLKKFAGHLSRSGIPIFYLGELFERDEVRDLLALTDLKFSLDGHSLVRVAEFVEYKIPPADAQKIIARQKENGQTLAEVLTDEKLKNDLSGQGRAGAEKLAGHLSAFSSEISAWSFLAGYLFSQSGYLKPLFAADDVQNQAQRLGIYQFLRLAQAAEARFAGEPAPIPAFLQYIKKLAFFNEDKNYAQIPVEAENLDAVRLLTVHSAKGLEFPVVFLPYLGAGKFPGKKHPQTCPDPVGMTAAAETDFHEEEEECLFFVAMSRARDRLHLSRAGRYGESNSNESKFLKMLAEFLPPAVQVNAVEREIEKIQIEPGDDDALQRRSFYSSDLDRYQKCPRKFFYTNVLGLKGAGEKTIYLKFHSCVYDTLTSMQAMRQLEAVEFSEASALARLDEFWQAAEVDAHPYAPIYRQKAEEIIRRAFQKMSQKTAANEILTPTFEVRLGGGAVRVRLDAVEIVEAEEEKIAVIRKYKTGKSPKDVKPDDADILMTVAVQENFPDAKPLFQRIYLSDDEVREVPVTDRVIKNRLKNYEKAIEGIAKRRFEPAPGDQCPQCPHYFICPSGGE